MAFPSQTSEDASGVIFHRFLAHIYAYSLSLRRRVLVVLALVAA